jgi:hypothetical protein
MANLVQLFPENADIVDLVLQQLFPENADIVDLVLQQYYRKELLQVAFDELKQHALCCRLYAAYMRYPVRGNII